MSMGSKSNLSTKRGLGPLLPNDLLARMTNVWASACSKLNLSGIPSATLWYNFHKNLQTLVCFKPGWNLRLRRPSGAPSWTRLRRALPTLSKSRPAAIHTLRPRAANLERACAVALHGMFFLALVCAHLRHCLSQHPMAMMIRTPKMLEYAGLGAPHRSSKMDQKMSECESF